MLGFSKEKVVFSSDQSAFSLGGEFCAMTPAVYGQGDDSGNAFILLLIPPCGAYISVLLSSAVCPASPHPPKIEHGMRLCVQHPGQLQECPGEIIPCIGWLHCPAKMPVCLIDCFCIKSSCSLHEKTCNIYKAAGNVGPTLRSYSCTVVENAN